MNWNQLLSVKRLGKPSSGTINAESRTEFQRDYDRLIFSSPFRRLQNKTQVFPLPGSVFVHNRLTHSLEVASVGRSLGNMLSLHLNKAGIAHPLINEIGSVVAASCLAHDMGNPPFGHSGEDAIKEFFRNGQGREMIGDLSQAEKADLTLFDGNANAFRLLTHQFNGRRKGGYALTYTMLASIVKYPYESSLAVKPKFGFFQSEKIFFAEIAEELGLIQNQAEGLSFTRHPLVYLVEAADDICYQIMDIEDAHKLRILSSEETKELYLNFFDRQADLAKLKKIENTLDQVTDRNEQIAYLRAGVIGLLVNNCIGAYIENEEAIMAGKFNGQLMKAISPVASQAMGNVIEVSVNRVYCHPSVIEIELAGYKIISTLLQHFADAALNNSPYGKKLMKLFPEQYLQQKPDRNSKIQSVVDFVSGMTDLYALELYRKITGMNLPAL
ncbi:MAG: deoxyguanosinetriphosphate triphosphohydrolase [Prolixibacteraceae bacterium]|nr:deoxyguanosinetriphosphate triphosphohydrolase [Prolixibacteraceae bacterium]